MKRFKAMILAAASLAAVSSNSLAGEKALAPGKPAGVEQAARGGGHLLLILGVGAVLVGGVAVAMANSGNATPPTATSTTP
jgi:hypothetical protein